MSAACPAFAFQVRLDFAADVPQDARERCLAGFHAMLDARGLTWRGDGPSMTIRSEASQATDADREAVRAWLGDRAGIAALEVGELTDLREE